MPLITYEDLPVIRERHRDRRIVFCSGVFDLTHAGHILFFEDCKALGDILVVTVGNDAMIRRNKGQGRPILNENIRLKTVLSFKPVDYGLLERSFDNPLTHLEVVFRQLRPDIYAINDDAFDIPTRKKMTEEGGIQLVTLQRRCPLEFEQISTSQIIARIKGMG